MIARRDMLIGGALLSCAPGVRAMAPAPLPTGNALGFDIVRKGSTLGTHRLGFDRAGDALTVHVAVDLAFRIGFITLYRYSHRAIERWAGDQLVALQTSSNDDGDRCAVSGWREAAGFVVEGSKAPRYLVPADALPATHWNRRELDGPWINTQDGRLMHPKVTPAGVDAIPTASGQPIRADRFDLSGDVTLDLWYDAQARWAGLSFKAKDGSLIRYERL